MTSKKVLMIATLTLAGAGLLVGATAVAQAHDHGAAAGSGPASAKLVLKDGKKWPTDPALREGMAAVRTEVAGALGPIHSNKFTPAQYTALAGKIETQVGAIMSKCKLPPEADAQLHLVLADVFAGTAAMKAEGDRIGGAVKVINALDAYATHFEHAGWKRIQH